MKFKRKFEKNASEFLHFSESPSQSLLVLSKALEEALAGWIGVEGISRRRLDAVCFQEMTGAILIGLLAT